MSDGTAHKTAPAPNGGLAVGVAFCLCSISSIQFGSALSATAIEAYGPATATFLRFGFAAVMLMAIVRPKVLAFSPAQWLAALPLGIAMGLMTLCFFSAMQHLPLGLLVAIDFLGPLAVATLALAGWRLVWPGLALAGVILLSYDGQRWVGDLPGVLFALGAAGGWAAYILLQKRSGRLFQGLEGLAVSLLVAALVTLPAGLPGSLGAVGLRDAGMMLGLSILVPLLPYALEINALRRMPTSAFSTLMSLEPAVAAVAGFLVLGQAMTALQILGSAFVVVASAGVTAGAKAD